MAGSYPDVPGNRIPYDRDGTQAFSSDSAFSTIGTQFTSGNLVSLNDEIPSTNAGGSYVIVLLPLLTDLTGMFAATGGGGVYGPAAIGAVYTSPDTSNGIDGTWTQITAFQGGLGPSIPNYRHPQVASVPGVKGIRLVGAQYTGNIGTLHLYGQPSSGQTLDNLVLYDPTNDTRVGGAYFDFGDVPQTSSADKQFRVHNNSTTQTATNITISCETLTDTTPSVPPQFTFSTDGVTFGATATISSLASGATSGVLTVRRTTPSNAVLSLWWTRIVASAASWA